ncbi:glutamine amidotransferase-like class 1 domain-containing protein 1 [Haliotis rubra]|uniref:glutamine amidotransferase-like class 1 domain-containing protein 1 n=1 Tax=Haliotis rubra TaxID=36100 RepID=UPI001EE5EA30|nr:glutamine amidotransferase-like class 1 domain-containing protein 1 [Haliotis rubra]
MSAPTRPNLLMIVSSAVEGVSAQSFVQAYNLAFPTFTIQLASPNGRQIEYVHQDDSNRRWFNEFRSKANSMPIPLESVDANRYSAMLIPAAPGALHDLFSSKDLAQIVVHFVKEKKAICAVGDGVAGLCGARLQNNKEWCFQDYSLTATSLNEAARESLFTSLPVLLEDFIKDHGGNYNRSRADAIHVVIDRHVITGQNIQSTLTAVQNLILMCSQK